MFAASKILMDVDNAIDDGPTKSIWPNEKSWHKWATIAE